MFIHSVNDLTGLQVEEQTHLGRRGKLTRQRLFHITALSLLDPQQKWLITSAGIILFKFSMLSTILMCLTLPHQEEQLIAQAHPCSMNCGQGWWFWHWFPWCTKVCSFVTNENLLNKAAASVQSHAGIAPCPDFCNTINTLSKPVCLKSTSREAGSCWFTEWVFVSAGVTECSSRLHAVHPHHMNDSVWPSCLASVGQFTVMSLALENVQLRIEILQTLLSHNWCFSASATGSLLVRISQGSKRN